MDQLIQAFGIDIKLIIIQIMNFVLLVGLLSYFLYKPLLKVLADREDKIAQGIKDAEAAAVAKSAADEEKKAVLATAHKDAEAVALRAKEAADAKASDIVSDANDKAAAVVKMAEGKAEDLQAQARKESEGEIAKLAVLAAEKLLRKEA